MSQTLPETRETAWSRRTARALATLTVAMLLTLASSPALEPVRTLPRDFDAAGGIRVGLAAGTDLPAARSAALDALAARVGRELTVRYNGISRTPRSITAAVPLSMPSGGAPEFIARKFLRDNRSIWGFSETNVDALDVSAAYTDRHNGLSHVYFTQKTGKTPVFAGVLGVHVDARGCVIAVHGDAWPQLVAPPPAAVDPLTAARTAAAGIGVDYTPSLVRTEGDTLFLGAGPFRDEVRVREWVYPLAGAPRRAHRMLLHKSGLEWYDILVDAATGEVLHRRNLYQFTSGDVTPSNPPPASPAAPRGLVYLEHPLQTVRGTGDLPRTYPLTADPTGRVRGFANAPLFGADIHPTNPNGANPVNATIDPILLGMPGPTTPLRSSALPLSTSPQSPEGWFELQAGQYVTVGNNVDAKDDHADDNEASIGQRANGGISGDFSGPGFFYQNFYAQNGPYASEGTLQPASAARKAGAAPDLDPAILTLFYANNWFHDLLYHLGFTEAAGNFQTDNFGLGGLDGDHVFADAQDGSGTNNANFGTPADGSSPRMQMFLFSSPERDGTLDVDVIIHEYSHGLSNRLVGGPNNVDCLDIALVGEAGGMGEGWGDWYGSVIADEPSVGEYATGDGDVGIRRFPMNEGPSDFTYSRICTGPTENPSPAPCLVHDIGEFWSITLWEMREAMINRFHNRAFPGTPYPTFTATDGPDGNIKSAQGRTTDGSGNPAQTDFASIENASFTAMFRVTDGMKLAPCNPSIVDMRDAILASDRAAGGEFQDVIWRAFANRGVGVLATSTGGSAPVTVESFDVPATVGACEAAGGPLAPPPFTAVSNAANEVTIQIVPNGAAEYVIYRSSVAAGSAVDPAPFVEVGRTSGATFVDFPVDGVEHFYRVRALRNEDCVSSSNVVAITPLGGPLPCTATPSFEGVRRAFDAGDCQRVIVEWGPATSSCTVSGPDVSFNVYRSTDPAFVPDATNRIATGVPGNTYVDSPGATEQIFHYIVRAEDSTTANGGPANGGNEEANAAVGSAMVTSGELVNQGFTDDVESGPDEFKSTHFTSSGLTVSLEPTRGGWYRDDQPSPVVARSGATVWHTFNPDNQSVGGDGQPFYELRSDPVTITPDSILTFHHTFQTEAGFDGGVLEIALVDPVSGLPGVFADAGDLIYENGYNGALDAPENTNALANRPAFTGGALGSMQRVRAFVGSLVPGGNPDQEIVIRFLFGSDVANLISVPPSTSGTFIPGWYIDDITIDESCCPISAAPQNLDAVASGDREITLTWDAPAGVISEYRIFREEGEDAIPESVTALRAVVSGASTSFVDTEVQPGVLYSYVVRAIPDGDCPSGNSNIATAAAFGVETPERKAPLQLPIEDDVVPDQQAGVDRDGAYRLSWTYPSNGEVPCAWVVEEATGLVSQLSDDAEEALTAGSNSTWTGDPTWSSDTHPDTGTSGYTPLYVDSQDVSLTLNTSLTLGAGAVMSFDSFEDIEDGFDAAAVEVSADGGAFTSVLSMTGTFSGRREIALDTFEGQDVLVRFRFLSDVVFSTPQYLGWHIDNVEIASLNFSPIATLPTAQTQLDISGRPDGTYHYRIAGVFGAGCNETGPYSNHRSIDVVIDPTEPLPPNAETDDVSTPQDTAIVIDVLANDSDPNNDPIHVKSVTQPAHGSVVINGAGVDVTYTPAAGFSGTDTFTYEVCDPGDLCDPDGRVFVDVLPDESPCVLPGIQSIQDATGDTNATIDATRDPSLDLVSVSFAEPFMGTGVEQLVVTIDVVDLTVPHPSAAWRAFWTSPDGMQYFVSLENCNAAAGTECSVGTYDGTLFSSTGSAADCQFTADGRITITANKSDLGISDVTDAGESLTNVEGVTQVFFGALCTGLLGSADTATGTNYTIVTNAFCDDECPNDPNKTRPGICGCGIADDDTDGDGTADCFDQCDNDPDKVIPGVCGCGVADTDSDNDGTPDCNDLCPTDPDKTAPGTCGCGVADTDSDNDGTPDCNDLCPADPGKIDPGACGCGLADDADGDGVLACAGDCNDNDPTSSGTPGEVGNLMLARDSLSGIATLTWDEPGVPGGSAVRYDTLRSDVSTTFTAATCVEIDDGTDRVAEDGQDPPTGATFYYLTRARNGCPGGEGLGTLGQASDGTPREGAVCP